ncbi:MAG TPA: PEP-CTERM sorting domain-containing protein [Rhodocyclaceae bacterium]
MGNLTFGGSTGSFTPSPLNTQTTRPMIAPYWTDLDTRGASAAAGIFINQTADKLVVTWNQMGYFSGNYRGSATFQLVLNNPNAVPAGEGAIGFFFGDMTATGDYHDVTSGFGDGLPAENTGEISYARGATVDIAPQLSQTHVWFNFANGRPIAAPVPEPETYGMMMAGLGLLGAALRRRKQG